MNNIVILISGGGSNMAAIVKHAEKADWAKRFGARVTAVVSNKADAQGLVFARQHHLATAVLDHKAYPSREAFDVALMAEIDRLGGAGSATGQPALVVLAGFMRILGPAVVDAFPGRIINTHPALLPLFPGAHAVRDALVAGAFETGSTVHVVDAGVDTGPVIVQEAVAVLPGDDEASLHERIKVVERRLLAEVVTRIAKHGLTVHDRKVTIA